MSERQETVRDVCAEMKDRENLDGRDMCDNFHIEYGDYGGFDGLELIKAYADRILAAHEREMAAKDAEMERLKEERNHARLDAQRKFKRIELLERALKPVMECDSDFDSCAWMADQLDEEQMDAVDGLHTAVREAQRIMKEGEEK